MNIACSVRAFAWQYAYLYWYAWFLPGLTGDSEESSNKTGSLRNTGVLCGKLLFNNIIKDKSSYLLYYYKISISTHQSIFDKSEKCSFPIASNIFHNKNQPREWTTHLRTRSNSYHAPGYGNSDLELPDLRCTGNSQAIRRIAILKGTQSAGLSSQGTIEEFPCDQEQPDLPQN